MSDPANKPSLHQPDEAQAARRFWKLWQYGSPPDLAEFVRGAGPLTPVRLAAVVCVDLRERFKRHQRQPAEEYLQRFPELRAAHEAAVDVVYCEFLLRDEAGEKPTAAEYVKRFPDIALELGRQIDMHRLLQAEGEQEASQKTTVHEPSALLRAKPPSASSGARNWPILPGYEILDRLGRGGMGVVYKAWQEKLCRVVAIKMLQADAADSAQAAARFRVEGEAIARLHHANILQVYEVGEHDGQPYLVMEFADGGTLAQKVNGLPWRAADAAQMVETLARAVHYAHQRGVLHRDLTPGNVLLFGDGTPKLSDFGLARLVVGGGTLTQTGAVVGTPSYMSPEQARGSSHEVGPTGDVYSLGSILFELLTGRPPFQAATPLETLALVAHAEPVSPRQLQPSVPRDLETICIKCLRKEPGRRYASAADLADDLKRFQSGDPIRARPVGKIERLWRWGRHNPGWASALLLLMVTAVGAVAATLILARALHDARHARHDTQRKLYSSIVSEAQAKRLSGRVGQRSLSLALLQNARKLAEELHLQAHEAELRNEVIACLALPDLELLQECDGFPAATYGLDFDESLTLYARGDIQGNISVRRLADDVEVHAIPGEGQPEQLRFSPDARLLALSSAGMLRLWQLDAGKPYDAPPVACQSFSFGMRGRQLAILHGDGLTVSVRDLDGKTEVYRGEPGGAIANLAFHPHLPILALACDKESLIFDLSTRKLLERLFHPDRVGSLAWSQDGQVLATSCLDRNVRVFEVLQAAGSAAPSGLRQRSQFFGHGTLRQEIQLSRDGSILAAANWAGNLRLWDTSVGQQLLMPLAEGRVFRFAASDDRLACTAPDGKLRVYRTIPGNEFRRLPSFNRSAQAPARAVVFHPAGRLLFAAAADGLVSIDTHTAHVQALPLGRWALPIVFDSSGALITESAAGFERWPAQSDPARPERIRLGPPQPLFMSSQRNQEIMRDKDQRSAFGADSLLAIPGRDGIQLLWAGQKNGDKTAAKVLAQKDVRYCAISPDGRLAAGGSQDAPGEPGAVVWDSRSGERVHDIPALPRSCDVGFSPDGRWLITTGGGCRLWDTATWQPGPVLGGSTFAFAPNGQVVAVDALNGQVRLVEPATGKELARLTAPAELHSLPACFSADGAALVVYGTESQALQVWDLRAVRDRLRDVDLDWNMPSYAAPTAGPTQVLMITQAPG